MPGDVLEIEIVVIKTRGPMGWIHCEAKVDGKIASEADISFALAEGNLQRTMSTSKIHATAVIDPSAQIGADVEIGAYAVIGPDCIVGEGTILGPHVILEQYTELGKLCQVRAGAVLGGPPQDNKFKGERSFVRVGDRTQIREFVTIHRSTGEDEATTVGEDGLDHGLCPYWTQLHRGQ